jgi:uncharacterized membrane protein YpjA
VRVRVQLGSGIVGSGVTWNIWFGIDVHNGMFDLYVLFYVRVSIRKVEVSSVWWFTREWDFTEYRFKSTASINVSYEMWGGVRVCEKV